MLSRLKTLLLYYVVISLSVAASIDENVGRVNLSRKESLLLVFNVTSSSETPSHSVLNANLPLTPNVTHPPISNPNLPRSSNAILSSSFNVIPTTILHTTLSTPRNAPPSRVLDAILLPSSSFTRIHTAPTFAVQHSVSPTRAASHFRVRANHAHSRDGRPPSGRFIPKIAWLNFKADATAASSWKSPVVRTAPPGTAGSSGLYIAAVCGVPRVLKRSRRIVNGTIARPGQWPWMVNIARKDASGGYTNICGGSLVTDRHVLTAAHCTYETTVTLNIILGGLSRSINLDEIDVTKIMEVRSIRRHDRSSWTAFANDIAIIELEYPVTFTTYILPICLPDLSSDFLGHQGTILGWGKIHGDAEDFSSTLRQAEIPIQSQETCLEWYRRVGFKPVLRPEFMCAGFEGGGKDACGGDSGGPLMVRDEWGRWVLAGIVSHGYGCAEPYQPGLYINVSFYLPWIHEQLAL